MKTQLLLFGLLAGCQSIHVPTTEELTASLKSRGMAFGLAMEHSDIEQTIELAAPSARGFFEATKELDDLLWEKEEREPKSVAVKAVELRGSSRGLVQLMLGQPDTGNEVVLHFDRVEDSWGVVGFARDMTSDPRAFAAQESRIREQLAAIKEEMTPHPDLGPMVEDYIAAAAKKDMDAMTKHMTPECAKQQRDRKSSFSNSFASGEIAIQKWRFRGFDVEGNEASQRVTTVLVTASGETDNEPMRFAFAKTAAGWRIREVN